MIHKVIRRNHQVIGKKSPGDSPGDLKESPGDSPGDWGSSPGDAPEQLTRGSDDPSKIIVFWKCSFLTFSMIYPNPLWNSLLRFHVFPLIV